MSQSIFLSHNKYYFCFVKKCAKVYLFSQKAPYFHHIIYIYIYIYMYMCVCVCVYTHGILSILDKLPFNQHVKTQQTVFGHS